MRNLFKQDKNGWTEFNLDSNVKYIFISTSGSDANNGLSSSKPVKTIAKGLSLVDKTKQNCILLKSGDVFGENFDSFAYSGLSSDKPFVITKYGTGPRPAIAPLSKVGFLAMGKANIVISHIEFRSKNRDTDQTLSADHGIRVYNCANIWIEGCLVRNFKFGITAEVPDGKPFKNNFICRRNVVVDNWSTDSYSQGLYCSGLNGIWIEENVLDHNGWFSTWAKPTIFNHNMYITGWNENVNVLGNISSNASSHGCQMRSGGISRNNFFYSNPLHLSFGLVEGGGPNKIGGCSGVVENNVMLRSAMIKTEKRSCGIQVANIKPKSNTSIKNNIIANDNIKGILYAISLEVGEGATQDDAVGIHDLLIENNISYNWNNKDFIVEQGLSPNAKPGRWQITNTNLVRNYLKTTVNDDGKVKIVNPVINPVYKNPGSSNTDYSAFINEARKMSKENWNPQFTAYKAINDVRVGFNMLPILNPWIVPATSSSSSKSSKSSSSKSSKSSSSRSSKTSSKSSSKSSNSSDSSRSSKSSFSSHSSESSNSSLAPALPEKFINKIFIINKSGNKTEILFDNDGVVEVEGLFNDGEVQTIK